MFKHFYASINLHTSDTSVLRITKTDSDRIASKFQAVVPPNNFHTTKMQ